LINISALPAGSETCTIPVQELSSGMYMLRVRMNNEAHFGIACSDEYFQLGSGYTSFPWGFGKISLDNYNVGLMIRCVK